MGDEQSKPRRPFNDSVQVTRAQIEEYKRYKNESENCEQGKTILEEKFTNSQEENKDLNAQLKTLEEQNARHQAEIAELQATLSNTPDLTTLQEQLQQRIEETEDLKKQLAEQSQLRDVFQSRLKELEESQKNHEQEIERWREDHIKQLKLYDSEEAALRKKAKENLFLKSANENLLSQIQKCSSEISELREEHERQTDELQRLKQNESSVSQEERDPLASTVEGQENKIKELEEDLNSRQENMRVMTQKITTLETESKAKSAESTEKQKTIDGLNETIKKIEEEQKRRDEKLKQTVAQYSEQSLEQAQAINSWIDQHDEDIKKIQKLKQELQEVKDTHEAQLQELAQKNADAAQQEIVTELQTKLNKRSSRIAELEASLNKANDDHELKLKKIESERLIKSRQIANLKKTNAKLYRERLLNDGAFKALNSALEVTRQKRDESIKELNEKIRKLQSDQVEHKKIVKDLQTELDFNSNQLEKKTKEFLSLQRRNEEVELQNQALNTMVEQLMSTQKKPPGGKKLQATLRKLKEEKRAKEEELEGFKTVVENNCEKGAALLHAFFDTTGEKKQVLLAQIQKKMEEYYPKKFDNRTGICAANATLQVCMAVCYHFLSNDDTTNFQKISFVEEMLKGGKPANLIMELFGFAVDPGKQSLDLANKGEEDASATCMGDNKDGRFKEYFQAFLEEALPLKHLLEMKITVVGSTMNNPKWAEKDLLNFRSTIRNALAIEVGTVPRAAFTSFYDLMVENPQLEKMKIRLSSISQKDETTHGPLPLPLLMKQPQQKDGMFRFEEPPKYLILSRDVFDPVAWKVQEKIPVNINVPVYLDKVQQTSTSYEFVCAYIKAKPQELSAERGHAFCVAKKPKTDEYVKLDDTNQYDVFSTSARFGENNRYFLVNMIDKKNALRKWEVLVGYAIYAPSKKTTDPKDAQESPSE